MGSEGLESKFFSFWTLKNEELLTFYHYQSTSFKGSYGAIPKTLDKKCERLDA